MQGLWSTHRRNKLNLNTPTSPDSSLAAAAATDDQETSTAKFGESLTATPPHTGLDDNTNNSVVNGKRKTRSSRTIEGSSKRTKIVASGGTIAKDHSPPNARLSDLGGIDSCIEKMLELVAMPLCHPEVYLHTGVQPPRGVLLHGPPGCGKTLLAHAMAGVSGQPFHAPTCINCARRNLVYLSFAFLPLLLYQVCQENQKRHLEIRLMKQRYVYRY